MYSRVPIDQFAPWGAAPAAAPEGSPAAYASGGPHADAYADGTLSDTDTLRDTARLAATAADDPALHANVLALHARAELLLRHVDKYEKQRGSQAAAAAAAADPVARRRAAANGKKLETLDGLYKFKSIVRSELKFLSKLLNNPGSCTRLHAKCTNVPYLESIFSIIRTETNVTAVHKKFHFWPDTDLVGCGNTGGDEGPVPLPPNARRNAARAVVRCDVVCEGGMKWIKVKARNAQAMDREVAGAGAENWAEHSDDSEDHDSDNNDLSSNLARQALTLRLCRSLRQAALQNPVHYKPPRIVLRLVSSSSGQNDESIGSTVSPEFRRAMEELDIEIDERPISPLQPLDKEEDKECKPIDCKEEVGSNVITDTLLLDVTTMLVLFSELSYDKSIDPSIFDINPLVFQAQRERAAPILPILLGHFRGRRLLTIDAAASKIFGILRFVAGPRELARARQVFGADVYEKHLGTQPYSRDDDIAGGHDLPTVEIVPTQVSARFAAYFPHMSSEHERQGSDTSSISGSISCDGSNSSTSEGSGSGASGKSVAFGKAAPHFNAGDEGRIQHHHVQLFGTADTLKCTVVTANLTVPRALREMGIHMSTFAHEPRSLVEARVDAWRTGGVEGMLSFRMQKKQWLKKRKKNSEFAKMQLALQTIQLHRQIENQQVFRAKLVQEQQEQHDVSQLQVTRQNAGAEEAAARNDAVAEAAEEPTPMCAKS